MAYIFQSTIMQIVIHGIQIAQLILVILIALQKHALILQEQLIFQTVNLGYQNVQLLMIILLVLKRLAIITIKISVSVLVMPDVQDLNLTVFINHVIVVESKPVQILPIPL